MALDFPSSPSNGQTYISGGKTWIYRSTSGGWEGASPPPVFNPRGLSGYCSGKPGVSEVVTGGVSPYAFSITEANCFAKALVAATGSTTFVINKNGTQIGTVVFAAAATLGTVDIITAAVVVGDYITIVAPATADATLANISFLLVE